MLLKLPPSGPQPKLGGAEGGQRTHVNIIIVFVNTVREYAVSLWMI